MSSTDCVSSSCASVPFSSDPPAFSVSQTQPISSLFQCAGQCFDNLGRNLGKGNFNGEDIAIRSDCRDLSFVFLLLLFFYWKNDFHAIYSVRGFLSPTPPRSRSPPHLSNPIPVLLPSFLRKQTSKTKQNSKKETHIQKTNKTYKNIKLETIIYKQMTSKTKMAQTK